MFQEALGDQVIEVSEQPGEGLHLALNVQRRLAECPICASSGRSERARGESLNDPSGQGSFARYRAPLRAGWRRVSYDRLLGGSMPRSKTDSLERRHEGRALIQHG